jgi:hypothetical protein
MQLHSAQQPSLECRVAMFPQPQTHLATRCNSTSREALRLVSTAKLVAYSVISAVDQHSPAGHALSAVASNNDLFLKHSNAPIYEGYSLNQIIQLLVTVQEALGTVAACRLQYGDDWLMAQGLDLGLDIDDLFIANYEHLLLRLQEELVQVLTRKALEELLRGNHDKRQRKLLSWFTEFAEKPMPLSTSFPWTIKPSLAVLWGVCWMFYDRDASDQAARAGDRVRQDRVLQHLDFSHVQWSAPASSDCKFACCCFSASSSVSVLMLADVNFGLELIGAQPQHNAQQAAPANVTAAFDGVFQARNTDSWDSDLSPLDFRLPSHEDVGAIGSPRFGRAPPQLPGGLLVSVSESRIHSTHRTHARFSLLYLETNRG